MCASLSTPAQTDNRDVRVAYTQTMKRVTYRGSRPNRGFVRHSGKVISGVVQQYSTGERVFYPEGANADVIQ